MNIDIGAAVGRSKKQEQVEEGAGVPGEGACGYMRGKSKLRKCRGKRRRLLHLLWMWSRTSTVVVRCKLLAYSLYCFDGIGASTPAHSALYTLY